MGAIGTYVSNAITSPSHERAARKSLAAFGLQVGGRASAIWYRLVLDAWRSFTVHGKPIDKWPCSCSSVPFFGFARNQKPTIRFWGPTISSRSAMRNKMQFRSLRNPALTVRHLLMLDEQCRFFGTCPSLFCSDKFQDSFCLV